jgi:uncharacterized protein
MANLSAPEKIACALIGSYQKIRPRGQHRPCCRFYPSCSNYGKKAISKYGLLKGGWLLLKRLIRCHPLSQGGFDDVT